MLKLFCFISIFISVLSILIYLENKPKLKKSEITQLSEKFVNHSNPTQHKVIEEINQNNSKIKSIYYPKITIQTGTIKIESTFIYEKDKNFRMINRSIFGKEGDIGSNNQFFWFWSRRMNPPALFYSKHENLFKTRLKTPFMPVWMMETVGINVLDVNNITTFDYKEYLGVQRLERDVLGKQIKKVYLIDKNKKAFYGHYLFDNNDKPILSCEIYDYYLINEIYFPKEIGINWYEEDINLHWQMDLPLINSPLNAENWQMPDIQPQINMGK